MAGMKFEYDDNGGKFYYFCLSFYALILLPTTYWLWPKSEKRKGVLHPEDASNFPPCRRKYQLIYVGEPGRKRRARLSKFVFVFAWLLLFILAYRVSLLEIEHKDYDPFIVLNLDQEASVSEIKRAYRELSKIYHPDRGGDPEKFKDIAKAYKTLTDEEAKENWKKYGNPDGPGVTHFGIALPKWLVDHQNALVVLLIYTGVFMIVLPVLLCIWRQKSTRSAGDQISNDTIFIYAQFLRMTSLIAIKRVIMILSLAREFDRTRNPVIIDRPSDNIELPKIIRQMRDVREKPRGSLQVPYSIKARVLIHAHLRRLDTLSDDLEKDKRYIIKRSIYLLTDMINIEAQVVAANLAGQINTRLHLDTIENTMKLSAMIVQALLNPNRPLLQLPHITEAHLRFFATKKRMIKSLEQFAALDDEQRRSILRTLSDEEYSDLINVLSIYPYVTMDVSWGVVDDDNERQITAEAIVTLTVHLHRENMSVLFGNANVRNEEITEDHTNRALKNTSKKKKKGQVKSTHKKPIEISSNDDDSSKHSYDSHRPIPLNDSENDDESMNNEPYDDDEFMEKFQQKQRKRELLETKAKISHRVFCPFYPEIKQECWWLYVADRKNRSLITQPIYICTLKDHEEIEMKFKAPQEPGHYDYFVCLRSDSYFGLDCTQNLPMNVEAARGVGDNHPQWNFSEEEGEMNPTAEDDQFATESDSDAE